MSIQVSIVFKNPMQRGADAQVNFIFTVKHGDVCILSLPSVQMYLDGVFNSFSCQLDTAYSHLREQTQLRCFPDHIALIHDLCESSQPTVGGTVST